MIVHFLWIFKCFLKRGTAMSKAAVICEFNPFHNGHKFLLKKIKSTCADDIACIMSGALVQRGDIAVTDKYARTLAALENGADMVVELPTVYAMAPAQVFAENGVKLAYELGCERLCFGAESSLQELETALDRLDSDSTQAMIAERMQSGCSYPRALSETVGENCAAVIRLPNNILALEYIRACRKYGLSPVAIKREGVSHDNDRTAGRFASASKIRAMIRVGEEYSAYTPMKVETVYSLEKLEPLLLWTLKTKTPEELAGIAGISEGLNHRLCRCAAEYNSVEEILEHLKTKRYTMARLRRVMLSALLGITGELQRRPVPYLRVLGVKREKIGLIQSRSLPLIVDVRHGYDGLDNSAEEIFDIDIAAAELMNAAGVSPTPLNEFLQGIIKTDNS